MITLIGAFFVALALIFLLIRPALLPWLLSAAIPFSASAGINVAGQSIAVYSIVAIVLVLVGFQSLRIRGLLLADLAAKPGLRPLLAFGAWSLLVTLVAPTLFAGTRVIDPKVGIDFGVQNPSPLVPTLSNFAQLVYLFLGIMTVATIGSLRHATPHLPAAGFALGTVTSSVKSLLPEGLQEALFDNSMNYTYTTGTFNGIERMRGVFSEPSALGAFSVSAAIFFLITATTTRGAVRYASIGMGIWAFTNAILSFSGGALVCGLIILGLVAARAIYRSVVGQSTLSPAAVVSSLVMVPVLVIVGPRVIEYINLLLSDKVESSSYENRSAADQFSLELAREVYGIGVGVGSNRPSSFFASLLAGVGVIGLVLLGIAFIVITLRASRDRRVHPVVWALISILVSKILAGPDLSDPSMWFLLSVCAATAWNAHPASEQAAGNLYEPRQKWKPFDGVRNLFNDGPSHAVGAPSRSSDN